MNRVRRWCDVTVQRKSIVQWISFGWNRRGEVLSKQDWLTFLELVSNSLFYFIAVFSFRSLSHTHQTLLTERNYDQITNDTAQVLTSSGCFYWSQQKKILALHSRCTIDNSIESGLSHFSVDFFFWNVDGKTTSFTKKKVQKLQLWYELFSSR